MISAAVKPLSQNEMNEALAFLKLREKKGGDMLKAAVAAAIRSKFVYTLSHTRRILKTIPDCKLDSVKINCQFRGM